MRGIGAPATDWAKKVKPFLKELKKHELDPEDEKLRSCLTKSSDTAYTYRFTCRVRSSPTGFTAY